MRVIQRDYHRAAAAQDPRELADTDLDVRLVGEVVERGPGENMRHASVAERERPQVRDEHEAARGRAPLGREAPLRAMGNPERPIDPDAARP